MGRARDIQAKIRGLLQHSDSGAGKLPEQLQAYRWLALAEEYAAAAEMLDGDPKLTWPLMNVTGHALECALKGLLAGSRVAPPKTHDLIALVERAEACDLPLLTDLEFASIAWVDHYYHQDLVTQTTHKTRYPTATPEAIGGPIPNAAVCAGVVRKLNGATRVKLPQ
jgi:HEPN domain-containing protein